MANSRKIAILGSGNIGMSLARGLVKAKYSKPGDITLTRRGIEHLAEHAKKGFITSIHNSDAVANSSFIILAVLPQQLDTLLSQINGAIDSKRHVVISVISGVNCADIKAKLGDDVQVIRVMPNTAIAIGQSMTCIASDNASIENIAEVTRMFETVGAVIKINEDLMTSATALCACGVAFFLRAIRAASQGGIEIGFHADEALKMAVQTAKGAADLLLLQNSHPEHEIDKVTSPKGCTIAGLNEMEHQGFSSSLIKGIKLSALKAGELYTKAK
ncbi:pyrroline-5-carboxylate reductase [Daejeonella sp.]|uniref:pyrroline-5-carboxylate reductase n=1 Tax=Daejeonella sp. TaxID=2805397 RepID=UPI003983C6F4